MKLSKEAEILKSYLIKDEMLVAINVVYKHQYTHKEKQYVFKPEHVQELIDGQLCKVLEQNDKFASIMGI